MVQYRQRSAPSIHQGHPSGRPLSCRFAWDTPPTTPMGSSWGLGELKRTPGVTILADEVIGGGEGGEE